MIWDILKNAKVITAIAGILAVVFGALDIPFLADFFNDPEMIAMISNLFMGFGAAVTGAAGVAAVAAPKK